MSNPQVSTTSGAICGEGSAGLLSVDPFRSLSIHFGMLLGVDDFQTLSAYHRGKMWLHSAWLHGKGVVWGLGVGLDLETGEIRVQPGLALDGLGRELLLEQTACVNVARWLDENREDARLDLEELPDGTLRFDAHVVIRFKACLSRQVPALVEPCEGSGQTTAYSRVVETVELFLRPGLAPERREPPGTLAYHRLRLLFYLEEAIEEDGSIIGSDREVLDARAAILALPSDQQPRAYLESFRRFAALDQIDLGPAAAADDHGSGLFPEGEPGELVLADAGGLTLTPTSDGVVLSVAPGDGVDNTVRFVHLPTSAIQDLLNGPLFTTPVSGSEEGGEEDGGGSETEPEPAPAALRAASRVADAGGPRVDPASVKITKRELEFWTDQELHPESVTRETVSVTAFDEGAGWRRVKIGRVALSGDGRRVTVVFEEPAEAPLLRLVARGSGPAPILSRRLVPLAGSLTDPPAGLHDGHDFIRIQRSS